MKRVPSPTDDRPQMGVVWLLGRHIQHSASPAMQTAAFEDLGLAHRYELCDVPAEGLAAAVAELRSGGCLGANVTVPYKSAVLEMVDEVDSVVTDAGAANTVVARAGRLLASNTDVPALIDELNRLRPSPRRAVILGAGGAARAVKLALEMMGAGEVMTVSRSSADGAFVWASLPDLLLEADLLVNATPVGTNSDESPVPAALLHPDLAVLDLVYRPSPTRLVRDARAAGAPARAGAGVLLGQGWRSLEAWLGTSVDESVKSAMSRALRHELGEAPDV